MADYLRQSNRFPRAKPRPFKRLSTRKMLSPSARSRGKSHATANFEKEFINPIFEREELMRQLAQQEAEEQSKKEIIMKMVRKKLAEIQKRPNHIQEMRAQSFLPEPSQIHKYNVFYSSGNFPAQTMKYMTFSEPDPPTVSS